MALSELQKGLIQLLKAYEATEDEVIGIMLLLKTPTQQSKMVDWMEMNSAATVDEIIEEAIRLQKM